MKTLIHIIPLTMAFAIFCCSPQAEASNGADVSDERENFNISSNVQLIEVEQLDSITHECEPESSDCVESNDWQFSVNIGVGLRTNPLNDSNNIPLIIIPQWSYYGDFLFIENLDLGANLYQSDTSQINLIASPTYDTVFFNRWDPSNFLVDISSMAGIDGVNSEDNLTEINPEELSKREFSYMGGVEWSTVFDKHTFQASWFTELTDKHGGSEARFAYAYTANDFLSSTIGFTWKDTKLTDYFYGVDPIEIVDDRGVYQAKASLNPFVRFSLKTGKNKNSWKISLEYQKLSNEISNSPIANDDYVVTFFVGKHYDWN